MATGPEAELLASVTRQIMALHAEALKRLDLARDRYGADFEMLQIETAAIWGQYGVETRSLKMHKLSIERAIVSRNALKPVDFTGLYAALDELRKPLDEVRE